MYNIASQSLLLLQNCCNLTRSPCNSSDNTQEAAWRRRVSDPWWCSRLIGQDMLTAGLRCCSTFNRQICVTLMSPVVQHAFCHACSRCTATGTRFMFIRSGHPDGLTPAWAHWNCCLLHVIYGFVQQHVFFCWASSSFYPFILPYPTQQP